MRRLPLIALAALLMCCSSVASAKDAAGKSRSNRSQWTQEMLDYKHDFIAEQTEMTQAQREKFMPLYEAMEKEVYAAHRTAREQARKVSSTTKASEQDYATAARAMSQVKVKEGEIEGRYFEKFSKILSKKQMFQLKQAELKFTRQMISSRGNKKKKK
jgi:Spy/CpxP family protein refolding chaperone